MVRIIRVVVRVRVRMSIRVRVPSRVRVTVGRKDRGDIRGKGGG